MLFLKGSFATNFSLMTLSIQFNDLTAGKHKVGILTLVTSIIFITK